jgi:hypothetical protein
LLGTLARRAGGAFGLFGLWLLPGPFNAQVIRSGALAAASILAMSRHGIAMLRR